jgi:hypothetical protein
VAVDVLFTAARARVTFSSEPHDNQARLFREAKVSARAFFFSL